MNDARRLEIARVDLGSLSALGINRQFDECGRIAVPFRKRPRSRAADCMMSSRRLFAHLVGTSE